MVCGILVPQPGIRLLPCAVKAQRPNRWTTREVPHSRIVDILERWLDRNFSRPLKSDKLTHHLPIYPSIHPFIHPSIHPFTYMHESAPGSAEQTPRLQRWGKRTRWWLREVLPVHWDQQVCLKCSGGSLWGQLIFKNRTVVWAPWHLAILWTRKHFFPYGGCLVPGSGERVGWGVGGGSAKWKRLGVSRRCSGWVCKWKFPR